MSKPGKLTLQHTGWAPAVLKEFSKVAKELPPVGGKGPVPFAPLTGNMVPVVMLHHIAIAPPPPFKRRLLSLSVSLTLMPLCHLQG